MLNFFYFVSKSVETLSFFQIRASSNRARSFFSAAAYASLPSKSRNGPSMGSFFHGVIPAEGWKVAQAYKCAILGAQTGRVYKVD